jgi:NAD(P)-dependent dehydrogenase (short-subunit alcohol dehydrogenase family)
VSPRTRAIVVTGASEGIGRAAAERLAQGGWSVIGIARHAPTSFPGEFIGADLADPEVTGRVARGLAARGDVLGIVNNVGRVRHEEFGAVSEEQFGEVLDLNLRPALTLTQALVPGMRAAGYGRIVNVTSLVTLGLPFRTSYAAAKAALESLTRTIAVECAASGVTANAVAPGPTETTLFRSSNPPGSPGEARYLAQIPMGRLGRPQDIGAAVAFLASDEAAFITGQTLHVDGGASLGRA